MHPILKDPGVVHIWYNIPVCTIFSQKSNGEVFRTKLHDSKSTPQSITNFEGGSFSYFSVAISWLLPDNHSRTQPPGPAGVGLPILIRTILRAILRGSQSFQSLSRNQVLRIPWTTQLVHKGSNQAFFYGLGPFGPIHIPLWDFSHTVQFSRWPELYWPNSDNTGR
ncbi:hypothetical protein O181_060595 [Austropuccinia psidii MF-1]|uniref:Uncharacterized protein n=1 Tax=Austropuccinia psidii MF-1 TaxID=1389203 RepID=A0A9Q3EKS4_9BASI|nr:hypothetical protein [Austropuccinia psidii MF-1]